jgi:predicted Zn-dependent protease
LSRLDFKTGNIKLKMLFGGYVASSAYQNKYFPARSQHKNTKISQQKLDTESNSIKEGDEKNVSPDEAVAVAEDDDNDLTEMYEDALAIAKAGKWAQKLLKVQSLDSLWYERLGETYLVLFEQQPVIDAFIEAIKLDHQSWRCFEGLTNAFAEKDNLRFAISEMEKALEFLREIKERDGSEHDSFLQHLLLIADWHTELHPLERAIKYYQGATHVDPYKYEAHYNLFKTLVATSKEEDAQTLLRDLHDNKSPDSPLSRLCAMFQPLASDYYL